MKKFLLVLPLLLLIWSCGPVTNSVIVWNQNLDGAIVEGLQLQDNRIYVADNTGSVYSIHKSYGGIVWQTDVGGSITTLHAFDDYIIAITHDEGDTSSAINRLDIDTGIIYEQGSVNIIPQGNHTVFTNSKDEVKMIVHSVDTICEISLTNLDSVNKTLSTSSDIVSVEFEYDAPWTEYYLVVDANSRVYILEATSASPMTDSNPSDAYQGFPMTCFGETVMRDNLLYIAGDDGIRIMSVETKGWIDNLDFDDTVESSDFFFNYTGDSIFIASASPRYGVGKYDAITLEEDWFQSTLYSVSYAPVIYNLYLNVVAVIDDQGYLTIVNGDTGGIQTAETIKLGRVTPGKLEIAQDAVNKAAFIPVNDDGEGKIYALSLSTAINASEF